MSRPSLNIPVLIAVADHRTMFLEHDILHRDVGLGNVMFDPHGGEGCIGRLIDFDLAKRIKVDEPNVATEGDFRTVRLNIFFFVCWI